MLLLKLLGTLLGEGQCHLASCDFFKIFFFFYRAEYHREAGCLLCLHEALTFLSHYSYQQAKAETTIGVTTQTRY